MERIKLADPCVLPPCTKVLAKKIERCNYIAHTWKNAHSSNLLSVDAISQVSSGSKISKDGSYQINWFDGECLPKLFAIQALQLKMTTKKSFIPLVWTMVIEIINEKQIFFKLFLLLQNLYIFNQGKLFC